MSSRLDGDAVNRQSVTKAGIRVRSRVHTRARAPLGTLDAIRKWRLFFANAIAINRRFRAKIRT